MNVIVVERVTPALRGKLTRWMIEGKAGVFVGTMSSRVRTKLWELVRASRGLGACTLIYAWPNEQGFRLESDGSPLRRAVDFDGLTLLRRPLERAKQTPAKGARCGGAAIEAQGDAHDQVVTDSDL